MVKKVRPEGARARLAYLADRYVSGDRHVRFIPEADLEALAREGLPQLIPSRTALIERDAPNYSIVFRPARALHGETACALSAGALGRPRAF